MALDPRILLMGNVPQLFGSNPILGGLEAGRQFRQAPMQDQLLQQQLLQGQQAADINRLNIQEAEAQQERVRGAENALRGLQMANNGDWLGLESFARQEASTDTNPTGALRIAELAKRAQGGEARAIDQIKQEFQGTVQRAQQMGVLGSVGGDVPADLRTFMEQARMANLSEEEIASAIKKDLGLEARAVTAAPRVQMIGGVPHIFDATTQTMKPVEVEGERVTPKSVGISSGTIKAIEADAKRRAELMAELDLKPSVQANVERAVQKVKEESDLRAKKRSNETAFSIYSSAMNGLMSGLGETTTGPLVGFLPALTANQQIADGAIAAMSPVLKDIFRVAGEGIFTDKDQELLLKMIPTRSTLPEARARQMATVDAIVRSKMGQPVMVYSNTLGRNVSMLDVFNEAQSEKMSVQQVMNELGME